MLKNDAVKKEEGLLNALSNMFKSMEYETEMTGAEENGVGKMISFDFEAGMNNEPVLANMYFLPIHEDEVNESYFVEALTITDEIPTEEKKLEMLQAVNVLNFNVAYGSFMFDTDIDLLTYRYTFPVEESMDNDTAFRYISRQTMMGIGIVSLYIAALNALLEDRITWEEYLTALAEILEENE